MNCFTGGNGQRLSIMAISPHKPKRTPKEAAMPRQDRHVRELIVRLSGPAKGPWKRDWPNRGELAVARLREVDADSLKQMCYRWMCA